MRLPLSLITYAGGNNIRRIEGMTGGDTVYRLTLGAFGFECLHFEFYAAVSAGNLHGRGHELFRKTHGADFIHHLGAVFKAS
jgi:hypothetical protein